MRLAINLASQPYQDVQRFLVRWGLATFAVALVTAGLLYAATTALVSWRVTEKQVHYLQQQIAQRDRQKAEVEAFLSRPENRETRDRSEFLNSLIARKAFSWTEVFTDLEHLMPPRLHVLNIQPQVNNNELEVNLTVAGSSRDAAIELVRRLEQSPHFTQAEILSEATQNSQNRADVVQFAISAIYIPSFARPQKQALRPAESQPPEMPASDTPEPAAATEARNARH